MISPRRRLKLTLSSALTPGKNLLNPSVKDSWCVRVHNLPLTFALSRGEGIRRGFATGDIPSGGEPGMRGSLSSPYFLLL
jgi:hypothetical protein